MIIDWNVLARQIALILVPVLLDRLRLPQALVDAISGPVADLLATGIVVAGGVLVGWVVLIGQRREKPAKKIEEVAKLPEVSTVVTTPEIAAKVEDPTVKSALDVVVRDIPATPLVRP